MSVPWWPSIGSNGTGGGSGGNGGGGGSSPGDDPRLKHLRNGPLLGTQVLLALAIGIPAFATFCVLRRKWATLYQNKHLRAKRHKAPPLRDSHLSWLVDLFYVTESEVLACAGLDAVVFMSFFKMAIQFLATAALVGMCVIVPVRYKYGDSGDVWGNLTLSTDHSPRNQFQQAMMPDSMLPLKHKREEDKSWLWTYAVFAYFFTMLVWYFLAQQTRHISRVRQEYLGGQSTVTDRTVRLSGVPKELRDEQKLADHMRTLKLGKVEQVVICRAWGELDRRMEERKVVLRKLEEAWTIYLGPYRVPRDADTLPIVQDHEHETEEHDHVVSTTGRHASINGKRLPSDERRPTMRLGPFGLIGKKVDCIDYFTVKLRKIDDAINGLRGDRTSFKATTTAFVTFRTVESAQLAAQAVLDPAPLNLVARLAPAPSDIIWKNAYLTRSSRSMRQWLVFGLVIIVTVLWFIPVGALSVLLSPEGIAKLSPSAAQFLDDHPLITSLTIGFLPTLAYTIFFSLVPFIFSWMSEIQGYLDSAEVELREVSKNFAFIFFNYFFVILIASSTISIYALFDETSQIPALLAKILPSRSKFYINLIVLQGLGTFPFRLLEFGTVSLYPLWKAGCKTPRDYHELKKGPTFNYAFYLPQPLFVFIICVIYSIMSPPILCFGLIFFVVGYFVFKYQLLYAMEHPLHSTGKIWGIIYSRIVLGVVVFQLTMIGLLSAQQALLPTAIITPLPFLTVIAAYKFWQQFSPLSDYIALRVIEREEERRMSTTSETVDEEREAQAEYGHPYLNVPLDKPWTPYGLLNEDLM
ncbi:hypothetical protein PYCC9005_004882 [Savitreella phatthalungensis]